MVDQRNADVSPDGRDETEAQRADRNFNELLQELRVAQTGVQILFAFLLTLPFTQRFTQIDDTQHKIYLVTLLSTALATVCLIAPVSHHRILFRQGRKPYLVESSSRLAGIGLVFLGLSMVGAVFFIFNVVVGTGLGLAVGAALAVVFVLVWYVQPLRHRRRQPPR
jgi:O-antigen/teichoic acid export membrane protein